MQHSASMLPHFDEKDPVVQSFLRPPAQAYYASATLFAKGADFLGRKLVRSERWHKIWWLPQVTSMAGNLAGYGYTRVHPALHCYVVFRADGRLATGGKWRRKFS
jgi:hypothetical protein